MATHYRTKALILKKRDFREADRFFIFFTKEFGKIEALAKAERKIKSKLRGGLELFYLSEIEFIQGRNWKTLTDTSLIKDFSFKDNLAKLKTAFKISKVFNNLVHKEERDLDLWELLLKSFERLEDKSLFKTFHYFFWNFVTLLGYEPELHFCVACQKKLKPDSLFFTPKEGGIVCKDCFKKVKGGKKVNSNIVKILRLTLDSYEKLEKIRINKELKKELNSLSHFYFSYLKEL